MAAPALEARFQTALLLCEAAGAILALAVNRYYDRLDLLTPLQALIVAGPLALLLVTGGYMAVVVRRWGSSRLRVLAFTISANLIGVSLALVAAELAVRALSVDTPAGRFFASTLLLPRRWEKVRARNTELLERIPANVSYLVPDAVLGWVPGRSRQDTSGMYATSVEGIRSAHPAVSYAALPAQQRVAIVGDSFTFGLEVPFKDSWGARLEGALGSDAVVLNFGVDGYGVDQAYLRYERDVRSWKPLVAVLGFIEHDLYRTLSVYSFVTFPEWGFPFSKPRFALKNGQITRVNDPLESPAALLARASVADLPFIDYDPGYNAHDWQPHAYDVLYLLRYLMSRFPRSPRTLVDYQQEEELDRINTILILKFIGQARANGTIPVVVYFPSRGDFNGQDRSTKSRVLALLEKAGVNYVDLTSCVGAVGQDNAFIEGRPHYSARGNLAVAECLRPLIESHIASMR